MLLPLESLLWPFQTRLDPSNLKSTLNLLLPHLLQIQFYVENCSVSVVLNLMLGTLGTRDHACFGYHSCSQVWVYGCASINLSLDRSWIKPLTYAWHRRGFWQMELIGIHCLMSVVENNFAWWKSQFIITKRNPNLGLWWWLLCSLALPNFSASVTFSEANTSWTSSIFTVLSHLSLPNLTPLSGPWDPWMQKLPCSSAPSAWLRNLVGWWSLSYPNSPSVRNYYNPALG